MIVTLLNKGLVIYPGVFRRLHEHSFVGSFIPIKRAMSPTTSAQPPDTAVRSPFYLKSRKRI
jgi:hypothetical protein